MYYICQNKAHNFGYKNNINNFLKTVKIYTIVIENGLFKVGVCKIALLSLFS